MEVIKVEMSLDWYKQLTENDRDHMVVVNSEPDDFDYSFDDQWRQLKSDSDKAYKARKKREYELRNNLQRT